MTPTRFPSIIVALDRTWDRRKIVRVAWEKLVSWSRSWRSKAKIDILERTKKRMVDGGRTPSHSEQWTKVKQRKGRKFNVSKGQRPSSGGRMTEAKREDEQLSGR
ncbi:hypothetical protein QYF36_001550 [Acer negundo]|nr:hypothetical protein QYF36_001550 [Acer negundo]